MTTNILTPQQPDESDEDFAIRRAAYERAVKAAEGRLLAVRKRVDAIGRSDRSKRWE